MSDDQLPQDFSRLLTKETDIMDLKMTKFSCLKYLLELNEHSDLLADSVGVQQHQSEYRYMRKPATTSLLHFKVIQHNSRV
ncbi:hypothetical protein T265_08386 [Opisthorchis viverrini]|uniref:Uncharacterized protein n=1 Tax=Opisthorchis viverrini TaxID=6198 RepID=A0A074ZDT9_OPIVI|nr:hypothetical protein T265_08386 [Opisthorchis viverrini]KER23797.1 hypothetical protein T265_08386 [Opisthorchis viverrini]